MAASDSTAPDAAQSTLPPPDPHKELHDALPGLQKAISLVKVATAAPVNEADPAPARAGNGARDRPAR